MASATTLQHDLADVDVDVGSGDRLLAPVFRSGPIGAIGRQQQVRELHPANDRDVRRRTQTGRAHLGGHESAFAGRIDEDDTTAVDTWATSSLKDPIE